MVTNGTGIIHIYAHIYTSDLKLIALRTASHLTGNQNAELWKVGTVSCELVEAKSTKGRWHCPGQTIGMKTQTFEGLHISQGSGHLAAELVVV